MLTVLTIGDSISRSVTTITNDAPEKVWLGSRIHGAPTNGAPKQLGLYQRLLMSQLSHHNFFVVCVLNNLSKTARLYPGNRVFAGLV